MRKNSEACKYTHAQYPGKLEVEVLLPRGLRVCDSFAIYIRGLRYSSSNVIFLSQDLRHENQYCRKVAEGLLYIAGIFAFEQKPTLRNRFPDRSLVTSRYFTLHGIFLE